MINPAAPGIHVVPDCLTASKCAAHIAASESLGCQAATITTRKGTVLDETVRDNARLVRDDVALAEALWSRLREHVPPFIDGWQAVGLNEHFPFCRYQPGQRFLGDSDAAFRRASSEESLLTLMGYLNDDFSAAQTAFSGTVIVPRQGPALLFRHALFHEGGR